jgi:hypothetical protein
MLQILAAELAEVDRLVFHVGHGKEAGAALRMAQSAIDLRLPPSPISRNELAERIASLGFEWGLSDGN